MSSRSSRDDKRPAALGASAGDVVARRKELDGKLLGELLAAQDPTLKLEAIRSLQLSPIPEAGTLLRGVATDDALDVQLRAEAIVGLAHAARAAAPNSELRRLLLHFAESNEPSLPAEDRAAARLGSSDPEIATYCSQAAARLPANSDDAQLADQLAMLMGSDRAHWPQQLADRVSKRPSSTADWMESLASGGDPQAGRRVFFHANTASCARCHTINGRGERIGPDLSLIARTMNRRSWPNRLSSRAARLPCNLSPGRWRPKTV